MALWGTSESKTAGSGTVAVNLDTKVVTGTNSVFTGAAVGDVISIGAGNTLGEAVISSITNNTTCAIAQTTYLIPNAGAAIAGYAYSVTQKPKFTLGDSHWSKDEIYGLDATEFGTASTLAYGGKAAGLAVPHGGWVGIKTYNDSAGNLRVKSEVLVAGGITGDADDDTFFKDA